MEKRFVDAVDKHRELILKAERYIWQHPETGYREVETSKYMEEAFEALGYELVRAEGITGFYTVIDTGRPGPTVLVLGELDAVLCPTHKEANPQTGAVHSCGHHAQCAALLGLAAALKEPGVLDDFCGKIKLCAVPAEELLEIEYRRELKKQGKIRYFGGKSEFLYRGYFDDVDLAFMVHTSSGYHVYNGSVGCLAKNVTYKGVAAHAAAAWEGKNALYAATCGLNAVNAIRETFEERDVIRVHPIITHGGEIVNGIPDTVQLESFVRGKTFEAICEANKKVNRALCGAALSMGCNIEIVDIPGYAPLQNDKNLMQLADEAARLAIPECGFELQNITNSGSTDMGELSCIMPVIHPYAGGAQGTGHGSDYYIVDPEAACVSSAKWQLTMLWLLLRDNAERALDIMERFQPMFASKDEYLAYVDSLNCDGDRIVYRADGMAEVRVE